MREFWNFIRQNITEIGEQTLEHIQLTLISLLIATLIGVSLGILISQKKRLAKPVLTVVNVIQTIPSIALLGFLLPVFGIGVVPAIIALFLYALLPIVRNTYTGIKEVDREVLEAATAMGMSRPQILLKVELPLAFPYVLAGIRTASVINVGVATLSAFIAAGGLGEFILRGIQLNNANMILAGAIPASLLALFFDATLGLLQKQSARLLRPFLYGFMLLFLALFIYVLIPLSNDNEQLTGGFPTEFVQREDGLNKLMEAYEFDIEYVELDPGLMYQALKNKKVDVISGFSTDGRIKAYDLFTLEDDLNYFPPYHAAAMVRNEVLKEYPELLEALNLLGQRISDSKMAELNYRVDELKEQPADVAKDFLHELGMKTAVERNGEGDLIMGSKAFTENYILAHMYSILIENYSGIDVEQKLGFGGTKLLMDAMKAGEVDLYPEYTGTALLLLLKANSETIDSLMQKNDAVYQYVKAQTNKEFGFSWSEPIGFNNTFALMVRKNTAEKYSLKSISDLAALLNKPD